MPTIVSGVTISDDIIRDSLNQLRHLPYREEKAFGEKVTLTLTQCRDDGRTIEVLNDDCNLWGVLISIANDLQNAMQFDGATEQEFTYKIKYSNAPKKSKSALLDNMIDAD